MGHEVVAERLACGTPVAALLATVTEGVPPPDPDHSASCAHCLDALGRLDEHWRRVQEVAAVTVPPPVGLEDRVLERVRALLSTGWVAVGDGGFGRTSVSEAALAMVAERGAAAVAGVDQVQSSRVAAIGGRAVEVHLDLTMRWGVGIEVVADQVRRAVALGIHAVAGLSADRVDVVVSDVCMG